MEQSETHVWLGRVLLLKSWFSVSEISTPQSKVTLEFFGSRWKVFSRWTHRDSLPGVEVLWLPWRSTLRLRETVSGVNCFQSGQDKGYRFLRLFRNIECGHSVRVMTVRDLSTSTELVKASGLWDTVEITEELEGRGVILLSFTDFRDNPDEQS